MALGTSPTSTPPPGMSATPGISPQSLSVNPTQGNRAFGDNAPMMGAPQAADTKPAPPVLFVDVDPVHFARLHPDELAKGGMQAARDAAMAAGQAAYDASTRIVASQQDSGDYVPPAASGATGATGATGGTGATGTTSTKSS